MDKNEAIGLAYRTEGYANKVKQLFDEAVEELLDIAKSSSGKTFSFSETKRMKKRTEAAMKKLHAATTAAIRQGIKLEWERADKATDKILATTFGEQALTHPRYAATVKRNQDALNAFLNRADNGMDLSQKVWKYTEQLKDEMEAAIAVSIGEGESAATIARKVKQYLKEPDKLFRRVRGADGKLHLSKAAAAYHPGRGVYRSSYKNAMRLARTETNMAYRTEDNNRVQQLDFVLGIRINLSKMHPEEDICDELKGDYPTDFMFTGWHPQCFCYSTTILPSDEELKKYNKALLKGEKYEIQGKIKDVPKAFKDWVADNKDKIETAAEGGKLPYFLRDNKKYWDENYKPEGKPSIEEIAAARHAARTPEDIERIQKAWQEKKDTRAAGLDIIKKLEGIDGVSLDKLKELMRHPDYAATRQEIDSLTKVYDEILGYDKLDNPLEVARKWGIGKAKMVNEAVERTLGRFSTTDLHSRKHDLEYEIDWVEDHKKYDTWKVSQDAYKKELARVEKLIKFEKLDKKIAALETYAYKSEDFKLWLEQAKVYRQQENYDDCDTFLTYVEDEMNRIEAERTKWIDIDNRIQVLKDFTFKTESQIFPQLVLDVVKERAKGSDPAEVEKVLIIAENKMRKLIGLKRGGVKSKTLDELKSELGNSMPKTLENQAKRIESRLQGTKYSSWSKSEIDQAEKKLSEIMENGCYGMNVPRVDRRGHDDVIDKIFNSYFKSQIETGTGKGMVDVSARKDASAELFGTDISTTTPVEYEKYGFLMDKDILKQAHSGIANQYWSYGDGIQIRFKKDKVIATFTMEDSLGSDLYPSLCTDPKVTSVHPSHKSIGRDDIDVSSAIDATNYYAWSYIELQYHNKLTLDCIESVFIPESVVGKLHAGLIAKIKSTGAIVYSEKGGKLITL